jgi:hypothetical protein
MTASVNKYTLKKDANPSNWRKQIVFPQGIITLKTLDTLKDLEGYACRVESQKVLLY